MSETLKIGDAEFKPGQSGTVDLPVGHLVTHADLRMRVHVFRGPEQHGPRLFVSGAIHGDEINGTEIARRLVRSRYLRRLSGDLIVVPVVNIPGFINRTRYLPDRRDLNRLFPGSSEGSFGARIARSFYGEVARKCTHGIDLHTGANGRTNLPQIRCSLDNPQTKELAQAFRAPVVLDAPIREHTLRAALTSRDFPVILYEAGEADRLDSAAVRFGLQGILSVMRYLEMLPPAKSQPHPARITYCQVSSWVRAPAGGLFRAGLALGKAVTEGQSLGVIGDPFSRSETKVLAPYPGVVIGRTSKALVDEGDALYHVALTKNDERAQQRIEKAGEALLGDTESPIYNDPFVE